MIIIPTHEFNKSVKKITDKTAKNRLENLISKLELPTVIVAGNGIYGTEDNTVVDVRFLPQGVYVLKVVQDRVLSMRKVVVR